MRRSRPTSLFYRRTNLVLGFKLMRGVIWSIPTKAVTVFLCYPSCCLAQQASMVGNTQCGIFRACLCSQKVVLFLAPFTSLTWNACTELLPRLLFFCNRMATCTVAPQQDVALVSRN
ncbi:hypothetical protein Y032_0139g2103 [Ancylostoma ceylanicum]|uniref:Uncharacterized protein n=1 Tax=Ancylostoma ceylanicum TaxID=53326 RepID=A0A016T4I7_9BILA|nr:hypothetical protein Y032_0139g2103 [Ancylostoma ceylanicum]